MNREGHTVVRGTSSTKCSQCRKLLFTMCAQILSRNNNGSVVCMNFCCHQMTNKQEGVTYMELKGTLNTNEEMIA